MTEFTGTAQADLNGLYIRTNEIKNGSYVYTKAGDDTKCCWRYAPNGKWYFSSTASKNAGKDSGWCTTVDTGVPHPAVPGTKFKALNDDEWEVQSGAKGRTVTKDEIVR